MSTLFDRLNRELETFGRRAQAALDEGKLQIELMRQRRQRDATARDLGQLIHRRERGGSVDTLEVDALLVRLDTIGVSIQSLEREIATVAGRRVGKAVSVYEKPAPETATPVDVEEM